MADHVDNEVLPTVYSSAGVVLNDHWRTMRAWGFVSNRLFDVLACGTPVISDPVDGIDELFDGAVLEYRTPDELRALVDEVLADPEAARQRAERGREIVLASHTFDHRAGQLLEALRAHLGQPILTSRPTRSGAPPARDLQADGGQPSPLANGSCHWIQTASLAKAVAVWPGPRPRSCRRGRRR